MSASAKVILHSIGPNNKQLITVEVRYWRAIHSELMTHRDRARNAASSRAIPFYKDLVCAECAGSGYTTDPHSTPDHPLCKIACKICTGVGKVPIPKCTYSFIKNDPFIPEFIGAEQKGMQSGGELEGPERTRAIAIINAMREYSLSHCKALSDLGVHKSIINRYLEPWSYITVLITATEWNNFFRLRIHPKAEKHFNQMASLIKTAIDNSRPQFLKDGEWHMPYIRPEEYKAIEIGQATWDKYGNLNELLKRISSGRCARLSYLTHEGIRDPQADINLFEALIHPKLDADRDDDVIHSSPLEHVAQASADRRLRSGPFNGWFQFRKEFPNENVEG